VALKKIYASLRDGMSSPADWFESVDGATGEVTQPPAATTLPDYTDEQFAKSLPGWRNLIESGKKSAEDIIAMVGSKARLNDDQLAMIRATVAQGESA